MFVHMSIHHPRKEREELLVASMHRFGEAMKDSPGFREAHTLKDETTGCLVGLALWDSKTQWEKARPKMLAVVKDDDFDAWELRPPEVFHLHEE